MPAWKAGGKLKVITNAGGLNPDACARACARILHAAGLTGMKIGIVSGDDVLGLVTDPAKGASLDLAHLETGRKMTEVARQIVTANAYFGATPIVADLWNRICDVRSVYRSGVNRAAEFDPTHLCSDASLNRTVRGITA